MNKKKKKKKNKSNNDNSNDTTNKTKNKTKNKRIGWGKQLRKNTRIWVKSKQYLKKRKQKRKGHNKVEFQPVRFDNWRDLKLLSWHELPVLSQHVRHNKNNNTNTNTNGSNNNNNNTYNNIIWRK